MQASRSCKNKNCRGIDFAVDNDSGNTVCRQCGVVQDFDNFQAHIGGFTGPAGTYVRIGTAGAGTVNNYKDSKIYHAKKLIEQLMFQLGLSGLVSLEVKELVEKITDSEYGEGTWFPVLVGACAYVVMRKDNKTMPIVQVADAVGCDVHELGKMYNRVVDFLDLKLPEFDYVGVFEHTVKNYSSFTNVSKDVVSRILQQGVLLMQCLVKWFVTTGRRPMPVVSAVLVFVAELNEVSVRIEEAASELCVAAATCKRRYREILEKLVDVAKVLPWGKDVTLKNVLRNAPFIMQYLEMKTMGKGHGGKGRLLEDDSFDVAELIGEFSSEGLGCGYGYDGGSGKESRYFEIENSSSSSCDNLDKFLISPEALSMVYSNHLDEISMIKVSAGINVNNKRSRRTKLDLQARTDWWRGKSDMSKRLLLKEVLEKDIGLEAMPPSFDHGCLVEDQRREKIAAAKLRIHKIMHPDTGESGNNNKDLFHYEPKKVTKKRKRSRVDIDWEDLIIETLLLHNVKEEEIAKGHYNVLLELHVFSHGIL